MLGVIVHHQILDALIQQFLGKAPWGVDEFATDEFVVIIVLLEPPQVEAVFDCIWVYLQCRAELLDELLGGAECEEEAVDVAHVGVALLQHLVDVPDVPH